METLLTPRFFKFHYIFVINCYITNFKQILIKLKLRGHHHIRFSPHTMQEINSKQIRMPKNKKTSESVEKQMEGLSFEFGEDYRNVDNQMMYGATIKLIHNNKVPIQNLDYVNHHIAQRIIKRSKQFVEDEIQYKNIVATMSKLNQYFLTKVAAFQLKESSSSQQQIEPQYQTEYKMAKTLTKFYQNQKQQQSDLIQQNATKI